ncbi:MAG: 2-oxoacid:acceptor oxidoreductase family protein [Oscillospiraceae bacterium]|nr:2-oxoacid:acceptor oxidoreductase family protein [Oscillospiraceae bacterium]
MMKSIILAGFGGQGILFAGRQLALAGMYSNKNVTWMPSYGAESRGGTSNCTVIISDEEIGSPIVAEPDILFVMNMPAYRKFAPAVAPGGVILANSSLIGESCGRGDITEYCIPATSLAFEHDMPMSANVIMLGKLLKITDLFTSAQLEETMRKTIPESRKKLLDLNITALDIGFGHE